MEFYGRNNFYFRIESTFGKQQFARIRKAIRSLEMITATVF